ncbi:MAG: Uma2 family endonuclease [Chloroflexi bacterium]|nr:Uma2 family endonuclease [Chloroflexota bacterium]
MTQIISREPPREYPEKEAFSIAENDFVVSRMVDVFCALRSFFRAIPSVLVGFKQLVYYAERDYMVFFTPDIFVARDVPPKKRFAFYTWEEGKAPDALINFATADFARDDFGYYREVFANLGVREYFIFDPLGEYLNPRLCGYRLVGDEYAPMNGGPLFSEVLGLELRVEQERLRLYDPQRGAYLLYPDELQAEAEQLEQENARLRAEFARLRGENT